MSNTKVLISPCSRQLGHWGMFTGLLYNIADCSAKGIRCTLNPIVGDSLIERARQEAFKAFLASDQDYLFFLDDDIQMQPDSISKLVESGKDIIAGVYRLKNDTGKCALRGLRSFKLDEFPDQVVEVKYVSTGCMLISRKAAQQVWDNYEALAYDANMVSVDTERRAVFLPFVFERELLSEDWAFCQRAISSGFKIYIHTGVLCGHWGLQCYDAPKGESNNGHVERAVHRNEQRNVDPVKRTDHG